MTEPTTIHWLTLPTAGSTLLQSKLAKKLYPRNGNGGAALVKWRLSTCDTQLGFSNGKSLGYLLGDKPPRYPVPAIRHAYSVGYYGKAERNLIEASFNACLFHGNTNKDRWFMFELGTQQIVMTDCPCCQHD